MIFLCSLAAYTGFTIWCVVCVRLFVLSSVRLYVPFFLNSECVVNSSRFFALFLFQFHSMCVGFFFNSTKRLLFLFSKYLLTVLILYFQVWATNKKKNYKIMLNVMYSKLQCCKRKIESTINCNICKKIYQQYLEFVYKSTILMFMFPADPIHLVKQHVEKCQITVGHSLQLRKSNLHYD